MNQQNVKFANIRRVYSLISTREHMSRVRLASLTQLSKTTVSALVDELLQDGYIVETGVDTETSLGRKPSLLKVNDQDNMVAVLSWYSRHVVAALVNAAGKVVFSSGVTLRTGTDPVGELSRVFHAELLPQAKDARILGVCVVVPGTIDKYADRITSTIVEVDAGQPILSAMKEAFSEYPLCVFNDTACYSYAELIESHISERNFVFVNIHQGVGALIYSGGAMLRSASGMTTQFGHCSVDRDGPLCPCGNHGCLETMIGEAVLPRRVEEFGIASLFAQPDHIEFRDIGRLLAAGNEAVLPLVQSMAGDLAFALSNLISLFHPRLVVIGGIGRSLGEGYLSMVRGALGGMGFPSFVKDVRLRYSKVDERAEIQGAARYFLDRHYAFDGGMRDRIIF